MGLRNKDGALVKVYEVLERFESAVKQAAARASPGRVYRYMRSNWVAPMLRDKRIRLSPFTGFNDPLELRPWGYSDSQSVPPGWDIQTDRAETWALVEFEARYRFLCLSRVSCCALMWAHYADSHRGVVLEFDAADASFQDVGQLLEITYTATLPRGLLGNAAGYIPFFTKSLEWSYEQETRLVVRTQDCQSKQLEDEVSSFRPFPATALRAVVFGHRCNARNAAAIRESLDDPAYRHVKIRTASMDFQSYQIVYSDV